MALDLIDTKATGNKIKKIMEEKNITVKEMSDILGISFQAVHKIVNGKNLPTMPHLFVISQVLGTTVDDLIVAKETKLSVFKVSSIKGKENLGFIVNNTEERGYIYEIR